MPRLFFVTSSRDGCERTFLARAFERREDRTTALLLSASFERASSLASSQVLHSRKIATCWNTWKTFPESDQRSPTEKRFANRENTDRAGTSGARRRWQQPRNPGRNPGPRGQQGRNFCGGKTVRPPPRSPKRLAGKATPSGRSSARMLRRRWGPAWSPLRIKTASGFTGSFPRTTIETTASRVDN
jgi:hypothetical protein